MRIEYKLKVALTCYASKPLSTLDRAPACPRPRLAVPFLPCVGVLVTHSVEIQVEIRVVSEVQSVRMLWSQTKTAGLLAQEVEPFVIAKVNILVRHRSRVTAYIHSAHFYGIYRMTVLTDF